MNAPTIMVRFYFRDLEGNIGTHNAYVPLSVSEAQMSAFIETYGDVLQSLSSASLFQVRTYRKWIFDSPVAASPDADLNSFVVLYYRNEEQYETIPIPSPKGGIFETEGDYQQIRVDPLSLAMAPWVDNWSDLSGNLTTKEGEPFPIEYLVGGLAL